MSAARLVEGGQDETKVDLRRTSAAKKILKPEKLCSSSAYLVVGDVRVRHVDAKYDDAGGSSIGVLRGCPRYPMCGHVAFSRLQRYATPSRLQR